MILIDPEFKKLIPPLTAEEYQQLEENILKEGIREPLTVWYRPAPVSAHILIDGHNRYEIAQKHNLHYDVREITFRDYKEAELWMIRNQLGRRNLSAYVRAELALKLKPIIAEKAKENQGQRTDISQKSVESHDTQKELAAIAGVSHDTIHKVEVIQEKATPEVKEKVRSGEISINQAHRETVMPSVKENRAKEIKEAFKRHEEFTEEKKNGIVSIDGAISDKDDVKCLADEYYTKIRTAISSVMAVGSVKRKNAVKFAEAIEKAKRESTAELIEAAIGILTIVKEDLNSVKA